MNGEQRLGMTRMLAPTAMAWIVGSGDRAAVRRVLYLATLSAVCHHPDLHAYYQRLRDRGVAPKAALIAALRKMLTILNAMLRDNTPWRSLCPTPA